MSTTTAPETFVDLYTDLQNRVRVTTGVTATENQAKRYINLGLIDMHLGFQEKFPWAEREGILVTNPRYTAGTVAISQGDTALEGTSTAWATANGHGFNNARVGGKIVIAGADEVYEVATVTDDDSIVLSSNYVGSDQTAAEYVYYEDEYDLASDFLRPVDTRRFSSGATSIMLIGRSEFRRQVPRNFVSGNPTVATMVDRAPSGDTEPRRRIVLAPSPDTATMIKYDYITKNLVVSSAGAAQESFSADDDEPIVPRRYRHAILFHALYHWYRDKKDDQRSQEVKAEYTNLMLRVVADNEIGANHASMRPRTGTYKRRANRPYTTGTKRFDINGKFDRFEI